MSRKCPENRLMSGKCPGNINELSGKHSISHSKEIDHQNSGQRHIPDKMSVRNPPRFGTFSGQHICPEFVHYYFNTFTSQIPDTLFL
jgi:hypothetical protein